MILPPHTGNYEFSVTSIVKIKTTWNVYCWTLYGSSNILLENLTVEHRAGGIICRKKGGKSSVW